MPKTEGEAGNIGFGGPPYRFFGSHLCPVVPPLSGTGFRSSTIINSASVYRTDRTLYIYSESGTDQYDEAAWLLFIIDPLMPRLHASSREARMR